MNRPFWSLRSASSEDICDSIALLLSAYTDGAASPDEMRRIETHLPACEDCRAALSWMQATRATLASRPIAVPPADLHSRIALAIAKASPAPALLRPGRVFTLRTVYAAAASVTALGIALSYPLWHTPAEVPVKHPAKPTLVATLPPAPLEPQLTIKPQLRPKAPVRPLVASRSVKPAAKHSGSARKIVPATPPEHVAFNSVPAERTGVLPFVTPKAPVHHVSAAVKIASHHMIPVETQLIEKHLPLPAAKHVTPKLPEGPKVAKVIKDPLRIPVNIQPAKVTPDLPPVRVASTHDAPHSNPDYGMGELRAHLRIQNATFVPMHIAKQEISRGAASMMHTVGTTIGNTDQTAIVGDIHGNQ